ncbi:MAG: phospholipase/Carboxylesterase [Subtercola sp.]|nr:phospholipase/Carboxylesterase [Subtercola sp.]
MKAKDRNVQTLDELQVWGESRDRARLAVLAVHGRTQSPADMRVIAERIGVPSARYYAPTAPGNSWYPQPFLAPLADNEPDLSRALSTVSSSLRLLEDEGFGLDHVVLLGFSQGACLLSHYLVDANPRVAGAVLFTGGYVGEQSLPSDVGEHDALSGIPIVMRSIENDPWVPPHRVRETARVFTDRGANVDLRIDAGTEHIITDEAVDCARTLLERLGRSHA